MKSDSTLIRSMLAGGMFFAAFLLSLFDFYFVSAGIAPFPVLGMLLLQPLVLFYPKRSRDGNIRTQVETTSFGLAMIAFYFLSALWGWFAFGGVYFKASIGMSMGIIVFLNLLLREDNRLFRQTLFRVLNVLLVVHLIFLAIQLVHFVNTATFLDFIKPVSGMETRNGFSGRNVELIRFTGLFAEPAIYATFVYMGLSVRLLANRFRWSLFDFILGATVGVSLSIIGIAMLGLLIVVSAMYDRRSAIVFGLAFSILVPTLVTLVFATETPIGIYLRMRLTKPLDDASGNERLVSGFVGYAQSPDYIQVMGKGLGNYDMSLKSTNGIAYLLEFLGAVGTFIFAALILVYLLRRGVSPVAILIFCATFAGAPMFTNLYWWMWAAMILIYSRYPCTDNDPAPQ